MQIVLRDDGASLEGTVKMSDNSGAGGLVVILPLRGTIKRPTFAGLSGEGSFRQDGLAPGEYLVFAAQNASRLSYDDAQAMESYLSQASHVTLTAGQTGKVALTLIAAGETSQ
jgi:hypothetical protein